MTMVQLFEHAVQLATQPLGDAHSEDGSYFIGGQPEQAHFVGALKDLVDREVSLEDEVLAVFDRIDRVVAAQVYGLAIRSRKLGSKQPTPVGQPLLDDGCAQLVGGRLQCLWVRYRQECVV